jgi:O-antigen/teichoic acid export membrane protein
MKSFYAHIWSSKKALVLSDQIIFSGNSFLLTILMARILTPEKFGVFASIILGIYFIINILNALIIQPLQVMISQMKNTHAYTSFSFFYQVATIIGLLIVISLFSFLEIELLEPVNTLIFPTTFFGIGFIMQDYYRKLFLAQSKVQHTLIIDFTTALLQTSVLVTSLFLFTFSLETIILLLGVAYIPSLIIGSWFIKPSFLQISQWASYLRVHWKQSKWLLLTAMVQWWSGNLFVVMSGIFISIEALGAFRLVQSLFGVLNIILQTFENYVLPQTSRLLHTSQKQAQQYLKSISIKSAIVFAIIISMVFVFAEPIILIAGGPQYVSYAYVIKGMSILYLIIFIGYPIRLSIRALILNKNFFIGYLFSLVFSLISFQYLLHTWGLTGAICGLIASQIIVLSYWQFILIKKNFILWK